ncbi:uncharacterized protein B0H18DRAFT_444187 [Fomitopsis serialis]|uniref:uncharacterized protein n=1 Tax=Fomitopsis serialis TaxID=139415 RepID=UPI0020083EFF|nr:uncharacterized protein B0H18DRAFT_444187 [Neoantrodia serialis]KAH9924018.1 hypothetical protein B0H18DRAFT_444187 [Neoantrodia serialis]
MSEFTQSTCPTTHEIAILVPVIILSPLVTVALVLAVIAYFRCRERRKHRPKLTNLCDVEQRLSKYIHSDGPASRSVTPFQQFEAPSAESQSPKSPYLARWDSERHDVERPGPQSISLTAPSVPDSNTGTSLRQSSEYTAQAVRAESSRPPSYSTTAPVTPTSCNSYTVSDLAHQEVTEHVATFDSPQLSAFHRQECRCGRSLLIISTTARGLRHQRSTSLFFSRHIQQGYIEWVTTAAGLRPNLTFTEL